MIAASPLQHEGRAYVSLFCEGSALYLTRGGIWLDLQIFYEALQKSHEVLCLPYITRNSFFQKVIGEN